MCKILSYDVRDDATIKIVLETASRFARWSYVNKRRLFSPPQRSSVTGWRAPTGLRGTLGFPESLHGKAL
jgi:hypothetical protein